MRLQAPSARGRRAPADVAEQVREGGELPLGGSDPDRVPAQLLTGFRQRPLPFQRAAELRDDEGEPPHSGVISPR